MESWDLRGLENSIENARKTVEDTAYFIVTAKKRDDWKSHQPGVELIFYLAQIDYETKVLIHRLFESPRDRFVWEKYLALHLYEALEQAPKAIGKAIREMKKPNTASMADPDLYVKASRKFRESLKPIRNDKELMRALEIIRNGVAAHHFDKGNANMDPTISWMLTSATSNRTGKTPFTSQIAEYSMTTSRAIQDFSANIHS